MVPSAARRLASAAVAAAAMATAGCGHAGHNASSDEVTLLVAASLQDVAQAWRSDIEREHPDVHVRVVADGSATLVEQLRAGAPADVAVLADERAGREAAAARTPVQEPVIVARNELVVALAPGNPARVQSMSDLGRVRVARCAPAVPCGRVTDDALDRAAVVLHAPTAEQSVRAVLTQVRSGNADAGLTYRSDAASAPELPTLAVPGAGEHTNAYPLLRFRDTPGARLVAEHVSSEAGRRVLREKGFLLP